MIELEICCGDPSSVVAAKAVGASRVELCAGLAEGGVTPSAGLVLAAAGEGIEAINVLIRPRPGDFLYNEAEVAAMERDVRSAIASGATGVVIGALTPDGLVDKRVCSRLIEVARAERGDVGVTFHRAFDLARDPMEALEEVIGLGCDCLLTSGMAPSAEQGIDLLRSLVEAASGRLKIMAGGGVNPANAREILSRSGVGALHSTARSTVESAMRYRREGVPMGLPGADEYSMRLTSAAVVAELRAIVSTF
ncbi:MAG: copper homeostasis protein CutC [[Clostridium] fimetarium]|nr:copper homeostasis protein CutC [Alistipes timonensis]MCM1405379.1 copper homeostasis protein CutC [[Clostridium] fimetarium]